MIAIALLLALFCAGETVAQDSSSAIRRDLDAQLEKGLTAGEASALARRGLALGVAASNSKELLNALSAVAAVCTESPPDLAREIRASALALLAREFHDSHRWSTLLTHGFLPDFDRLPPDAWLGELQHYEAIFDELAGEAEMTERLAAELAWARAYVRLHLDRKANWLSETQRQVAIARLDLVASQYGILPLPGSTGTVGDRARAAIDELQSLAFGTHAPPTAGVDLEGGKIDLRTYRGNVVILDFWTSFCTPCLAIVPHTKAMLNRLEGEAVSFIGVCGDETQRKGRATAERVGMDWPSLWDGPGGSTGPIATDWHVDGWPTVYVLDRDGHIRFKFRSRDEIETGLEAAVRTLLAETSSTATSDSTKRRMSPGWNDR